MVDLEWDAEPNADSYEVHAADSSAWEVLPYGSIDIVFYGTRAIVTGLPPLDRYYLLQVRALNAAGRSDWSWIEYVEGTEDAHAWDHVPRPILAPTPETGFLEDPFLTTDQVVTNTPIQTPTSTATATPTNTATATATPTVSPIASLTPTSTPSSTPTTTPTPMSLGAPNVVLIFVDDLGYNDVSFNGATDIDTPNIDRIAEEGIKFNNGYVAHASCAPSRARLMTGRYPARFGFESNISTTQHDPNHGLPTSETIFPRFLQDAGYRTGMVGKWHLGGATDFHPLNRGFDYFFGFLAGGHRYFDNEIDILDDDLYASPLLENRGVGEFDGYLTDVLTNKAIEFINEDSDEPYFLYLSYNAPHTPLRAPSRLVQQYDHIDDEDRRTYLAMVHSLDENVGRLLDELEALEQRENTMVFFTNDNGGPLEHTSNYPLKGGKGNFDEGGLRVPFAASWPARWPQGVTYDPMIITMDISATVLAAANAQPSHPDRPLDGIDLDPFLRAEVTDPPHEALYWRWLPNKKYAVRSVVMKLISLGLGTGNTQLFNLDANVSESPEEDLFDENIDVVNELADLWNEWNNEVLDASYFIGIDWYQTYFRDYYLSLHEQTQEMPDAQPYQIGVFSSDD